MNRAAVAEIAAIEPAAVVVKGDLTASGHARRVRRLPRLLRPAFGDRLHHVRGNHDAMAGADLRRRAAAHRPARRDDRPARHRDPRAATAGPLDDRPAGLARRPGRRRATVPVLVMAHHYPWSPDATTAAATATSASTPRRRERLVEVIARRPPIVGCFAGHTHRNRVRRFSATGPVPYVEVGLREGLPRDVGRVPGVRGRHPAAPPPHLAARRAGVERALPRPVRRLRRRLRRLRPRRPHRSVLRLPARCAERRPEGRRPARPTSG